MVIVLFLSFSSCLVVFAQVDERLLTCQDVDQDHTLCLPEVGPACGSDYVLPPGLTGDEIEQVLKIHNDFRAQVANGQAMDLPSASNMKSLSWNQDLALVAQAWANQCLFDHDHAEARIIPGYDNVGQNMYLQTISKKVIGIKIEKSVTKWYDEINDFEAEQVDPFKFTYNTGHFSQLAWAETDQIGCGWSNWMQEGKWKRMLVCNYAPGGNMMGAPMYQIGDPCSACSSTCMPDVNLCR